MRDPVILLDLGNVLVKLDFARGLARLLRLAGPGAPAISDPAQVFLAPAALAFNRGDLEPEAFLRSLAEHLDVPEARLGELSQAWSDIFDPWPEMESLADELLASHRVYLLSNTDALHLAYLLPRMPVLGRLSGLHLSFEARAIKPDQRFFELALRRWALDPARCLFIDDRSEHCAGARSAGIESWQHRGDVAELRKFLRSRGVQIR